MLPNKILIQKIYSCLVQFLKWVCFSCVDKLKPFIPKPFMFALAEDWRQVWWCLCTKQVIRLDRSLLDLEAWHSFMWANGPFLWAPKQHQSPKPSQMERDKEQCCFSMGCTNRNRIGWALMCSLLHSSVWKRKNISCGWPDTSQLDRANTGFQILTSHGVNIFKRYLYVTRNNMSIQGQCDRLMTFFTLRAETHTRMDQLWSVAHVSSLSYPSIPPCSSGWHCCSIQPVGTPLPIPKGSR